MATFPKGSGGYKGVNNEGVTVYIASEHEQKGKNSKGQDMTGFNVAFAIDNAARVAQGGEAISDPMLHYGTYEAQIEVDVINPETGEPTGEKQPGTETRNTYTMAYSKEQMDAINKVATITKGLDAKGNEREYKSVVADLMPAGNGKGLVLNTKTLKSGAVPFDREAHMAITRDAQAIKAAAREAKAAEIAAQAPAPDTELEK